MSNVTPIIVGEIGSYAHGLNTIDSDHDYIGVYVDRPEALIGLEGSKGAVRDRDKPEGVKSEAGDSETQFYGLRKYVSLACEGNPTVMTLLFTPNLTVPDLFGLQAARGLFMSKRLVARHIGYADNMAARLTGEKAPRTNRPELVEKYGYDTKAAFHALRLLMQGVEMLAVQDMQMPMWSKQRQYLLDVRAGRVSEDRVLQDIQHWKYLIQSAGYVSDLPEHPDMEAVNKWLVDTHMSYWWMADDVPPVGDPIYSSLSLTAGTQDVTIPKCHSQPVRPASHSWLRSLSPRRRGRMSVRPTPRSTKRSTAPASPSQTHRA